MNKLEKEKLEKNRRVMMDAIGNDWERDAAQQVERDDKEALVAEEQKEKDVKDYNSQEWLKKGTPEADRTLLAAVQEGKGWACELFYKLMKRLKDKTGMEIRIGLTGDEVARRNLEAEKQLREGGFRVADVPDEPALLSQEIREDKGQTKGDNLV